VTTTAAAAPTTKTITTTKQLGSTGNKYNFEHL